MGISFKKKSDFHLSNGVFPMLLLRNFSEVTGWEILRGAWKQRVRVTQKLRLSTASFLSVYLSSVPWLT
jgi:hypothetical protein